MTSRKISLGCLVAKVADGGQPHQSVTQTIQILSGANTLTGVHTLMEDPLFDHYEHEDRTSRALEMDQWSLRSRFPVIWVTALSAPHNRDR